MGAGGEGRGGAVQPGQKAGAVGRGQHRRAHRSPTAREAGTAGGWPCCGPSPCLGLTEQRRPFRKAAQQLSAALTLSPPFEAVIPLLGTSPKELPPPRPTPGDQTTKLAALSPGPDAFPEERLVGVCRLPSPQDLVGRVDEGLCGGIQRRRGGGGGRRSAEGHCGWPGPSGGSLTVPSCS